jgi:hypothetical protein
VATCRNPESTADVRGALSDLREAGIFTGGPVGEERSIYSLVLLSSHPRIAWIGHVADGNELTADCRADAPS